MSELVDLERALFDPFYKKEVARRIRADGSEVDGKVESIVENVEDVLYTQAQKEKKIVREYVLDLLKTSLQKDRAEENRIANISNSRGGGSSPSAIAKPGKKSKPLGWTNEYAGSPSRGDVDLDSLSSSSDGDDDENNGNNSISNIKTLDPSHELLRTVHSSEKQVLKLLKTDFDVEHDDEFRKYVEKLRIAEETLAEQVSQLEAELNNKYDEHDRILEAQAAELAGIKEEVIDLDEKRYAKTVELGNLEENIRCDRDESMIDGD